MEVVDFWVEREEVWNGIVRGDAHYFGRVSELFNNDPCDTDMVFLEIRSREEVLYDLPEGWGILSVESEGYLVKRVLLSFWYVNFAFVGFEHGHDDFIIY